MGIFSEAYSYLFFLFILYISGRAIKMQIVAILLLNSGAMKIYGQFSHAGVGGNSGSMQNRSKVHVPNQQFWISPRATRWPCHPGKTHHTHTWKGNLKFLFQQGLEACGFCLKRDCATVLKKKIASVFSLSPCSLFFFFNL